MLLTIEWGFIERTALLMSYHRRGDGEEGEGSWGDQSIAWLLHSLYHKLAPSLPTSELLSVLHGPSVLRNAPQKGGGAQIQRNLGNVETDPF